MIGITSAMNLWDKQRRTGMLLQKSYQEANIFSENASDSDFTFTRKAGTDTAVEYRETLLISL
jgi:hypothetical protein